MKTSTSRKRAVKARPAKVAPQELLRYWVLYRYWIECSMGEGSWDTTFHRFNTLRAAQEWIEEREDDPNYHILTAPLTLTTK